MCKSKIFCLLLCTMLTTLCGLSAMADDTEVFFGTSTSTSDSVNNPNILLVLDTSGSMDTTVKTTTTYDPTKTYSGNCNSSYVYFRYQSSSSSVTEPSCDSDGGTSTKNSGYVNTSNFICSSANTAFNSTAGKLQAEYAVRWTKTTVTVTKTGKNGYTNTSSSYSWQPTLKPTDSSSGSNPTTTYTYAVTDIVCQSDSGAKYPNNVSPNAASEWTTTNANSYWKTTTSGSWKLYTFYSANYLNWYYNYKSTTLGTRLSLVQTAATNLIGSLSDVNVGLMRYDAKGNGGMVLATVQPTTTGASTLDTAINSMNACGDTPLSETLYEAYLYLKGDTVNFGNNSYTANSSCSSYTKTPSVAAARVGGSSGSNTYQTPVTSSCQKNYVVFLTDGLANGDTQADSNIKSLPGTSCYSGDSAMWSALGDSTPSETHSGGLCLKALSKYMYENNSISDTQNVSTYFIGFGEDVAGGAPEDYLRDAATAGGGQAYTATDYDGLANALNSIIVSIREDSASFTSPSVAVNSFNKTQVLEDMYVSLFKPTTTTHWPGNVKKFKFRNDMIVGQDTSTSAVDPKTGFFKSQAKDFWQQSSDTNTDTTTKGGAANMIPDPASRNVYTYIGSNSPGSLQALSNQPVNTSNSAITSTLLNIGGASDPSRDVLINWARGDADGDPSTTGDTRHVMGDPIHAQPGVVIYGSSGSSTTDKLNDAVVYISTNDGYFHAIDVSTGTELWSYIPQELLSDLKNLYANNTASSKHYSLDGNIRVLKYDVNGDGVVTPSDGDRVFVYFSQGRGGDHYYALDVTDKNNPKFMWSLGQSELGIVSKSWSTPTLARVKVGDGSTQNTQKLVLVIGAGYDDSEESISYNPSGDTYGNGLFMIDAVKGTILWSQTKSSSGAFQNMTHAIPSNVAVLDTDGDGWTDRMYVGDMAGQLWRFDITNGNSSSSLVAGGVIASLGAKVSATDANNRSFYNAPDVSFFTVKGGANYYNIAIGSGDRALPKSNTATQDRFYAIRDYNLAALNQSQYNSLIAIKDSDLTTIDGNTTVSLTDGTPGWKLPLSSAEKSLSQSTTLDGTVMFTTFLPGGSSTGCTVTTGSARSYSVNVSTGLKKFDDLYEEFSTTGLPPQVTVIDTTKLVRTDGTSDSSSSSSSSSSSEKTPGTCLSGVTILNNCVEFGSKVKTFWKESGAN